MIDDTATLQQTAAPSRPIAQAIALAEMPSEPAPSPDGTPVAVLAVNPLHAVRARLQACVGGLEVTIGELLAAKEHQVFALDCAVDAPIDLLLEGKVVARGQLVAVDGCFGVRITELPVPLQA